MPSAPIGEPWFLKLNFTLFPLLGKAGAAKKI